MLTVVCFKWTPPAGYRSTYGPEQVLTLRSMVERHYPAPHRFVCVTDDAKGLESIETVKLWNDHAWVPNPSGTHNPSCYRRLKVFSKDAEQWFGPRFICLDLDTVIVGDLTPIFDRPEEFVIWGEQQPKSFYNGSMFMLTAGARTKVWETFDPFKSPRAASKAGRFGSDQGWIAHCLGKGEATWGQTDGVYSYRVHIAPFRNELPANARIVNFHGRVDPWDYRGQQIDWVRAHYN